MLTDGRLPFVDRLISMPAPDQLYHYTNSTGLIGIVESKQLWAGRAADMNDKKEQLLAFEMTKLGIENWLNTRRPTEPKIVALLQQMSDEIYATNRQVYTVSLSAHSDMLSQWRAYTPRSGGFALGLPGSYLRTVANDQGFYLAQCLYDNTMQWELINSILEFHVKDYQRKCQTEPEQESSFANTAVKNLAADVAQYGPLVKDGSFKEESEWRLVSLPSSTDDSRLGFYPGITGLRVYLKFSLLTAQHDSIIGDGVLGTPGVVVGPSIDSHAEQLAVQMLLIKNFGLGCWHTATSTPYR